MPYAAAPGHLHFCLSFLYDYSTLARMKPDIQIAREAVLKPIQDIASDIHINTASVIPYGFYTAKIPYTNSDAARIKAHRKDNGIYRPCTWHAQNRKKCSACAA